jgi:hypothetical protein
MDSRRCVIAASLAVLAFIVLNLMSPVNVYAQPETFPPGSEPYGHDRIEDNFGGTSASATVDTDCFELPVPTLTTRGTHF